jgi:hypothetical protein
VPEKPSYHRIEGSVMLIMVVSKTAMKGAPHNKKSARRLREAVPEPVTARLCSPPDFIALIYSLTRT